MDIEIRAERVTNITGHHGFVTDVILDLEVSVPNAIEVAEYILNELTSTQFMDFLRARFPNEVEAIEAEARA